MQPCIHFGVSCHTNAEYVPAMCGLELLCVLTAMLLGLLESISAQVSGDLKHFTVSHHVTPTLLLAAMLPTSASVGFSLAMITVLL